MSTTKPKAPEAKAEAPKPKLPVLLSGEVQLVLRNGARTKTISASPNKAPGDLFVCEEHKPKRDGAAMSVVGLSKMATDAGWELVDVK